MRKLLFVSCIGLLAACSDASKEESTTVAGAADSTAAAVKIEYPYTLEQPYKNWQPGDQQLAVTAMKALQAFEKGDVAGSVQYFADSVQLRFDYLDTKLSNDSLKKFFTAERAKYSKIVISMGDWESVISEDKKTTYVTMWYKQESTDLKGKVETLNVVDDCKMVNGKIAELDEKVQHLPVKK